MKYLGFFGYRLIWTMIGIGMWMVYPTQGYTQDWSVQDRDRRHRVILQRFMQVVEANPERGYAFDRLVKMARQWPGLDRLLQQYRKKVHDHPNNTAYRLILAHLLYTTRQRQDALMVYQKVVEKAPKLFLGHIYVADLYRQLGKNQEALVTYQKALALAQRPVDKRRCLKALGTLALQLKKPQEALTYWRSFLQLSPNNVDAREEIARSLAGQQLYTESLEQWQQILKRTSGSAKRSRVWRQIGLVHEQAGHWREAVKSYRQSMSYTQKDHWLRRELSERILQLHREHRTLAELVEFLRKKPKPSAQELAVIAKLLDELGRDEEAAVAYRKALAGTANDSVLRRKYITLLEVRNKSKEAISQYRILIQKEPSEPRHRLAFAEMLSRMGKHAESLAEMKMMARTFRRNTEMLGQLAQLYRKRRMVPEALELYQRLVRLEPREAGHRRTLGDYYFHLGQEKKAQQTWRGILNSGMPPYKSYLMYGQILRDHGFLRESLTWHIKAWRLRPKDLSYLMQVGELYQRIFEEERELSPQGLAEAIRIWKEIYQKANLRTRRKRAMQQLFALYQAQGTLYRLSAAYRIRLSSQPNDIDTLRWLGELELWQAQRRGQRSYSQAQFYFQSILKIKSSDLDAILTLEHLAVRQKSWRVARDMLLTAVAVHPAGRRDYFRRICDYSLKIGANQDAVTYAQKAIALNPEDASAHAELARIYSQSQMLPQATAAYREAIRLRPNSHSYSLALANLMRQQNRQAEAAELYRHVYKHAKDGQAIYEAATHAMDILLPLGKQDTLEMELQSLSETNPRELAYFRALAELFRRQGKMKAYHIAYLKAASTVDQKSQVYQQLAHVAQEQGDLPKAIIYFRKMLEETTNPSPQQQIQLANYYLQANDKTNARKILLALLNEHPHSVRILREIARLFEKYQLQQEAVQAYEMFLELAPSAAEERVSLAQLYRQLQKPEAAIGLLSGVLWNYHDRPILRKNQKKLHPKKPLVSTPRIPYYLRRHRYYNRYRLAPTRQQSLTLLIQIHQQQALLGLWEKRVIFALQQPEHRLIRYNIVQEMIRQYQANQWLDRLQRILEDMKKLEPRTPQWLQHLAQIYFQQKNYPQALATYADMERLNPRTKHNHFLSKLAVVVAMKDKARVHFLVEEYLHQQVGANAQIPQMVRLLKEHKYFALSEKVLQWGLKYSHYNYAYYIKELIDVNLRLGKHKQARALLWKEWNQPSQQLSRQTVRQLITQRQQLIQQLWPLLSRQDRQILLQNKEQELLQQIMAKRETVFVRQTLIDLYALMEKSQGLFMAQRYLPALWVLTSDTYDDMQLRHEILNKLFQQGEFKISATLIQQSVQRIAKPEDKLRYMLHLLLLLERYPLHPPRQFSRVLEKSLRNLRPHIPRELWNFVAIELADRYLGWGDSQRAIWWVALCQWTSSSTRQPDTAMLLRLARAYQLKGNQRLSQRHYRRMTGMLWQQFTQHPEQMLQLTFVQEMLRYRRQYLQRYNYSNSYAWRQYFSLVQIYLRIRSHRPHAHVNPRSQPSYAPYYRYLTYRARIRSLQTQSPLTVAQQTLQELYNTHREAGQQQLLFHRLEKFWQTSRDPKLRNQRFFYVMAAYHLNWTRERDQKSLHRLLHLLSQQLPHLQGPQQLGMQELMASLEMEAGQPQRALARYRKLITLAPQNQKMALLKNIAKILGQTGQEQEERTAHLRLSSEFNSGESDLWLAQHYREKQQVSEAVRFYQQYQKRRTTYRRSYSYGQYRQVAEWVELAKFLIPTNQHRQIQYFLLRANGVLRVSASPDVYVYQHWSLEMMKLLLQIRKLRTLTQEWETQLAQNGQDLHLLATLRYAYQTLNWRDKERTTIEQMLTLRPDISTLFTSLIHTYQQTSSHREGIQFLQKLYQTKTVKPAHYYLWLGRFYRELGQPKDAFAQWQLQLKECRQQPASYTQWQCSAQVAQDFLDADGIQESLHIYKKLLQQQAFSYPWMFLTAARKFLEKKAYRETVELVDEIRGQFTDPELTSVQVEFLAVLLQAHQRLRQNKTHAELIQYLKTASYRDYTAVQTAAEWVEKSGDVLTAEELFWQGVQKSYSDWTKQRTYDVLCSFWQRHNLNRLCDGEELQTSVVIEPQQRMLLAHRLALEGFPFLALLQLRKLRLISHDTMKLRLSLFQISLEVGRLQEAQLWWQRLQGTSLPAPKLAALAEQLQQAQQAQQAQQVGSVRHNHPTATAVHKSGVLKHAPSRRSWPAVEIPGWCQSMRVVSGTLRTQQCQNRFSYGRCSRQLLHHQGMLVTNDCVGRLIGVDAKTGRVRWLFALPRLSPNTGTITGTSSFSSIKKRPLFRYYRWIDIKSAPDGDILAVVNQNWLDQGQAWSAGIHERMILLRLRSQDGTLVWKKETPGSFARSSMAVSEKTVALIGRNLQVFRLSDGVLLWHRHAGLDASSWIFGSKDAHPLVATDQGFALVGWDQHIYHFDQQGTLLWNIRWEQPVFGLTYRAKRFYLLSEDGQLAALSTTGKMLWVVQSGTHTWKQQMLVGQQTAHSYFTLPSPQIFGQQIFVAGASGTLFCYSTEDGRLLWHKKLEHHGYYPVVIDETKKQLAHLGYGGVLSLLATDTGRVLWKYQLNAMKTAITSSGVARIHTSIQMSRDQMWTGIYQDGSRFLIHAFDRNDQILRQQVQHMQPMLQTLRQEKHEQLAVMATIHSLDQRDQFFRQQFLQLAQHPQFSDTKKLLWGYQYLVLGDHVKQDLAKLAAVWKKQPFRLISTNTYTSDATSVKTTLVRWMLSLSDSHPSHQKTGTQFWIDLCLSPNQTRLLVFADNVARRFVADLLQHPDPQQQWLAAFSLTVWGDTDARQSMLRQLARTQVGYSSFRSLQRIAAQKLFRWDSRFDWEGMTLTHDAPLVVPLLKHPNTEVRLRAALFLARLAAQRFVWRKQYDSPVLRNILWQGASSLDHSLSVLSARALAQLGDFRGIQQLRLFFRQNSNHSREPVARMLFHEFEDFTGLPSLLTAYQGQRGINLKLPSFRMIYAHRLFLARRYQDALLQYQQVMQTPAQSLSAHHRAMAFFGMGRCFTQLQRYAQAEKHLAQALQHDAFLWEAVEWQGRIAFQRKNYVQARISLERAIQALPYNERLREYLALTYFHLKLPEKAHALFVEGLQRRPEWPRLHAYYARALLQAPQPFLSQALQEIEKALQFSPKHPRFLQLKAEILFHQKKVAEAQHLLEEAIQLEAVESPHRPNYIRQFKQWFKRSPRTLSLRVGS